MLFNASVEVFFNDKISTWIYLVKRKYVFEIDFCWFQNAKVLYNFWTKSRSAGHSGALNRYAYPLSRPWATVHRSTCQLLSNKEDRQYKKCIYRVDAYLYEGSSARNSDWNYSKNSRILLPGASLTKFRRVKMLKKIIETAMNIFSRNFWSHLVPPFGILQDSLCNSSQI